MVERNVFYNCDCMEVLKKLPDQCIDLAVCDPPYGGGVNRVGGKWADKYKGIHFYGRGRSKRYKLGDEDIRAWDVAPSQEYFDELFRVSKEQVIWGGNYFVLPPTRCFLIWKKLTITENFSMAMCEYAWTSFNDNAKVFEYRPQDKNRFHPTQKPIELYEWVLSRYAKRGDLILDTHVGSGSCLIACHNMGCDYIGCEISKYYYDKASERLEQAKQQLRLF